MLDFEKAVREDNVKAKDHCCITGEYQGSAHKECNLNLNLTKKSLLCFIICKIMIHTLYFKNLGNIISK